MPYGIAPVNQLALKSVLTGALVCVIEGPGVFHMSYHVEGPWEEKLLDWFKADGGILR